MAGVGRAAAAAGEPDVHVDEHLAQSRRRSRVDGLRRVDGDRDAGPVLRCGERSQPVAVEHLVGQQQIVAQTGRRHAEHLAWRGARERVVTVGVLCGGERRALVRLHVRAQRGTGLRRGHRREVVLQHVGVDHQRRGGQLEQVHSMAPSGR